MRIGRYDENQSIWDYKGKDNFIVVPITGFVRKDGALSFVHPLAKRADEDFPKLSLKWGWMTSNGVLTPVHRTSEVNLIGMKDRDHYASAPDEEVIRDSLLTLNEVSWNNSSYVFYLDGFLGGEDFAQLHKDVLTSDRIVVLVSRDSNVDELKSVLTQIGVLDER